MSVKLLGLGFSFSGKDRGAKKVADGISNSVIGISRGLRDINVSARMNKLGSFVQSVSLHKLNQISSKLGDMASKAGSPELTSGLEQTFIQMEKTTAGVVSGLGLSGAEARKTKRDWASWAYSLGVGVDSVAEIGSAVHQTNLKLKDYGLGVKDLVKLQETYGVSGAGLVKTFRQLETTYNMTGKQARSVTDSIIAQGRAMGFGKETLAGYPELAQRVNNMFAKTFKQEGPEDFKKTMMGITKLGGVMSKYLGTPFDEGRDSAVAIFESLANARVGFQEMAAGMKQDMPGVVEAMAGVGISVDDIFERIQKDPVEFAQSMREANKRMREMGGKNSQMALMFTQRLDEVMKDLPDGFRQLIKVTGPAGAKIDKMLARSNSPVRKAEGALKDMSKAFRTGFDFDEQLKRARDKLEYTVSMISKRDTGKFVSSQRKAYADIGDSIKKFSKEKGPLGTLIKKFSLFRKIGLAALLPLDGMGSKFGALAPMLTHVAGASLPFFTALGSLGFRPRQIVAPFTMLLKPLGMMNKLMKGLPATFLKIFGPLGIIITLVGMFGSDFGKAFEKIGRSIPQLMLRVFFKEPQKKLSKMSTGDLWKVLGNKLWDVSVRAFTFVSDNFDKGVDILWSGAKKGFSFLWDKIKKWWDDPSKTMVEKAKDVGKAIGLALGAGLLLSSSFRGVVFKGFKRLLSRVVGIRRQVCDEERGAGSCFEQGAAGAAGAGVGTTTGAGPTTNAALSDRAVRRAQAKRFAAYRKEDVLRRKSIRFQQKAGELGYGGGNQPGALTSFGIKTRMFGEDLAAAPKKVALGLRDSAKNAGSFVRTLPSRTLRGMKSGFGKIGKSIGMVAKGLGGAVKSMGRMAGFGLGMAALSGSFDPLIEKLGVTKRGASALGTTLGGIMTGASVAGPWGAAVGLLVGAIQLVYTAFQETEISAKNMGKTVHGMLGKSGPTYAAVVDYNSITKNTSGLMKIQAEQAGLLERALYNLSDSYKKLKDSEVDAASRAEGLRRIGSGYRQIKALFSSKNFSGGVNLQYIAEGVASDVDRLGRLMPKTIAQIEALKKNEAAGIDVSKQMAKVRRELFSELDLYYKQSALLAKGSEKDWAKVSIGFFNNQSVISTAIEESGLKIKSFKGYVEEAGKVIDKYGLEKKGRSLVTTKSVAARLPPVKAASVAESTKGTKEMVNAMNDGFRSVVKAVKTTGSGKQKVDLKVRVDQSGNVGAHSLAFQGG
jgi:hypothetical protein